MAERRNFHRIPFTTDAEIHCNNKKYKGELLDISLQGVLIQGTGHIPLKTGNRCDLTIHLLETEIALNFEADLVHNEKNRLGFKFVSEDTETAMHLRRLLELNIGSSDEIEKEIAFWLKHNKS
jgi:c-di-GMP-binding flagellar brake protein YcgR